MTSDSGHGVPNHRQLGCLTTSRVVCKNYAHTVWKEASIWRKRGETGIRFIKSSVALAGNLRGVSLHMATPYEFSWQPIYADGISTLFFLVHFVLEIIWRLRITDAKPSSNFLHKLRCKSGSVDTPSTSLQPQENSTIVLDYAMDVFLEHMEKWLVTKHNKTRQSTRDAHIALGARWFKL